jgi:hypothetical protein
MFLAFPHREIAARDPSCVKEAGRGVKHATRLWASASAAAGCAGSYARQPGCAGIVSKRPGSRYASGRPRSWLKAKNPKRRAGSYRNRESFCHPRRPRSHSHVLDAESHGAWSKRVHAISVSCPRSILTYDRVARNFFALSSRLDGMIVYMRCNFSHAREGSLHCVDIRYPQNEKVAWDNIVTRISRSVRPLPAR